jgi:dipeptidyl aminopeptidase/acylaminoacyl peptidase
MKKIMLIMVPMITAILVSCAPAAATVPADAMVPTSTLTLTPAPTATTTITPTITPEPTPIGGGTLKVAFYGNNQSGKSFLIVGDYFSGKIDYQIPVRSELTDEVSWSPDGNYVLFVDQAKTITDDNNRKINLLNVKTGQVTHLSTFPVSDGPRGFMPMNIKWSPDSKYVLYNDNGTTVALVDGTVQNSHIYYSGWLSNSYIVAGDRTGCLFNIEKHEESFNCLSSFRKLGELEFTKDFMLLDPWEKDKVEAILYPEDISDVTAWEYNALISNKVTLITFAPEIQKPQIYKLMAIMELPNNQLSISGVGSFKVGEETYQAFRVIVDKKAFPMVVEVKNLYGSLDESLPAYQREYPVIFSPDGQLVLLGSMAQDETWYHLKLTLRDNNGQEIRVDDKMSQFNGLSKVGARVADLGSSATHLFLSGIDFYWQP